MRRALLICLTLIAAVAWPPAQAGPTAGGLASDNIEYVGFIPFEQSTSTGVSIRGRYMYLTSWKNISIYDVSESTAPELLSTRPIGFRFENENVSTNNKIMLFAEQLPGVPATGEACSPRPACVRSALHVWDVRDKTNPVEIATLLGSGSHTVECISKCRYSYGSGDEHIVDLRDPKNPRNLGNWMGELAQEGSTHDTTEYKRGFILTAPTGPDTLPIQAIDARDPTEPVIVASAAIPEGEPIVHSVRWPRQGKDRFMLGQGENNANSRCGEEDDGVHGAENGNFFVYDTTGWKKTKSFKLVDEWNLENGNYVDGNPAVGGLGCSTHWFEEHPTFEDGGLVALGAYEHGTKFLQVNSKGKIKEVGYFMPYGGSTSAAYWVDRAIVYAVDYARGVDILRWTGDV
ncbi:MAG: LVIVD repeat-containing protein [Actinomycetota bacterium]